MKANAPSRGVRPRRELIPVVVLVVAALVFAIAVDRHGLTTWTGPGFSMFSRVDYDRTRWVRAEVTTAEGVAPAHIPDSDLVASLKNRPDRATAEELAAVLLASDWEMVGGLFVPGGDGTANSVRLWVVNVHVRSSEIVAEELLTVEAAR